MERNISLSNHSFTAKIHLIDRKFGVTFAPTGRPRETGYQKSGPSVVTVQCEYTFERSLTEPQTYEDVTVPPQREGTPLTPPHPRATPKLVAQDDVGVRFWYQTGAEHVLDQGLHQGPSRLTGYRVHLRPDDRVPNRRKWQRPVRHRSLLNNTGGKYLRTVEYLDVVNGPILKKDLATDFKTGFIELPLTFKLMTNEIGHTRNDGQLGIGASYNIRAKADFDSPVDTSGVYVVRFDKLEDEDFQNSIQPFRALTRIVGVGLDRIFPGISPSSRVTYNNGFTNVKNVNVGDKKAKGLQKLSGAEPRGVLLLEQDIDRTPFAKRERGSFLCTQ